MGKADVSVQLFSQQRDQCRYRIQSIPEVSTLQILKVGGVDSVINQRQDESAVMRHHLKAVKSAIVECDNTQKRLGHGRIFNSKLRPYQ